MRESRNPDEPDMRESRNPDDGLAIYLTGLINF
jgi:hypothetical protein